MNFLRYFLVVLLNSFFTQFCINHYNTLNMLILPEENGGEILETHTTPSSKFSSLVSQQGSSLLVPLYERGRKIGSIIVEADVYKHMVSMGSSAMSSVNIPNLVNWKTNDDFEPSEETTHFMCRLVVFVKIYKYESSPHSNSVLRP